MQYDNAGAINLSPKHRIKLPRKKLYRTNSIAQNLRYLGKPFKWFTKNSISLELPPQSPNEYKRKIFICGALTCYKVRIDSWSYVSGGDFTYYEYTETTGLGLLYRLVQSGILDYSFLPDLPPYQKALMEKL